jgi:putative sterol carrier protein
MIYIFTKIYKITTTMELQNYFDSLEQKVSPQDLEGIDTKINFDLKDRSVYIEVKDSKIRVLEGKADDAEVSIAAKPEDLLAIIKGETNPMMAMMMGKLKISNPGAMLKYAKILGLM